MTIGILCILFIGGVFLCCFGTRKRSVPSHTETIECPKCGSHEQAVVEHTEPFYSYVHWCGQCGECIMEQEWQLVEPRFNLRSHDISANEGESITKLRNKLK